jgi:hypothetical protein
MAEGKEDAMLYSIAPIYLFLKLVCLFGLVRAQVKADPLKERWIFLGFVYTMGVAFLSYIFLVGTKALSWAPWQQRIAAQLGVSPWVAWLGETLLLSVIYFKLLGKYDEGLTFWVLILLGVALVLF